MARETSNQKAPRKTIASLLIANRGEIACRIIRTCKRLGIRTVAVYSDADMRAAHVELADEAIHIGPSETARSYLNQEAILAAARRAEVSAIHPGYGFLSENADFAERILADGLIFIGPSPQAMRRLGDKLAAKEVARTANVPIAPSLTIQDADSPEAHHEAADFTARVGAPVMVKAAGGGGGRGMRLVRSPEDLPAHLQAASREARAFFGNPQVFVEKFVADARHIEVQIIGDHYGSVRHLWDRDCSMQRHHQKIIEEAPAHGIEQSTRDAICAAAERLAAAARYSCAGTVEFLLDAQGNFYFLEVNSRLQVEHPVTEEVMGVDLVELQIRTAEGFELHSLLGSRQSPRGAAIECRICAESPDEGFIASTGLIREFAVATADGSPKVRLDSGFRAGDRITHYYDSLLAKLIVHADSREQARGAMIQALQRCELVGIKSNIGFLLKLLRSAQFLSAAHHVNSAQALLPSPTSQKAEYEVACALTAFCRIFEQGRSQTNPWMGTARWRVEGSSPYECHYRIGAEAFTVRLVLEGGECARVWVVQKGDSSVGRELIVALKHAEGSPPGYIALTVDGASLTARLVIVSHQELWLLSSFGTFEVRPEIPRSKHTGEEAGGSAETCLLSPLPGKVVALLSRAGDKVVAGTTLLTIESMKMEHPIKVLHDATIENFLVSVGQVISAGAALVQVHYE